MILRVEKISDNTTSSQTFAIDQQPEEGEILDISGEFFIVQTKIEFASHTTVIVRPTKIIKVEET